MMSDVTRTTIALLFPLTAGLALGCGGKAVVEGDQGGDGGAAGASSVASTAVSTSVSASSVGSTSVTASSSTGAACSDMLAALDVAVEAATVCDACSHFDGCSVVASVTDRCGCERQANGSLLGEVALAQGLYAEWVAAGCGPFDCGSPCAGAEPFGYCESNGSSCSGHCVGAAPPP